MFHSFLTCGPIRCFQESMTVFLALKYINRNKS